MPFSPNGDEFRVNTYTTSDQITYFPDSGTLPRDRAMQSIAMDDAGNFVIVWASKGQDDTTSADPDKAQRYGVYAQRYDANGLKVGTEFLVNEGFTEDNQFAPAVMMGSDGTFVVTWSSRNPLQDDKREYGVYAKRYTFTTGDALTPTPFRVNETTTAEQSDSAIARQADGSFIITWTSEGTVTTGGVAITSLLAVLIKMESPSAQSLGSILLQLANSRIHRSRLMELADLLSFGKAEGKTATILGSTHNFMPQMGRRLAANFELMLILTEINALPVLLSMMTAISLSPGLANQTSMLDASK
ncbi:MAG: hypothetical protein HC769_21465 [Cyanobacteria bacterium CRU_2_1]|nr:hypothetical protein [Cyanobacteria bacterium CRU_2_1]